jgi:Kef-type K+ transport system membrane component KefB
MRRAVLLYAIVIGASIAAIAGILQIGDSWYGPVGAGTVPPPSKYASEPSSSLAILIIQLLVIVVAAQICGTLARLVGQPAVIGEIAAGLLLGPSLLGHVWPGASAFLFPQSSLNILQLMSQVGVILFMFTVGLDLNPAHLRHQAPTAVAVSHFSIVTPFLLGVVSALALFPQFAPPGVSFHAFGLFMGIALSITAFPVLARVIEERGLTQTPLGSTAIACAAVDDVTAWSLLAMVVTLVTAGGVGSSLLFKLAALAVFVLLMVWVIRPFLERAVAGARTVTREHVALALGMMFASALVTEMLGIHALFGAFLAGAIMPQGLRRGLRDRLETVSAVLLLPLFFAFTGLRTEVGLLNDLASWGVCLGIILLAIVGKLVGSMLAARWTGSSWHDAFVIGALMNTRGLMELVALNVGYDLGILSPRMFTMLIVMALVTTAMTGPLVGLASVGRQINARAQAT